MHSLARAALLLPDLADAHLELARALERAGRIEAARNAYASALDLDPSCGEARAALARLPELPPAREDFTVGQELQSTAESRRRYKVRDIKRGGFGAVYVAHLAELNQLVVLKTFQARYLWRDPDRERFEREAYTWIALDPHPNIVSALWVEWIEGFPCLALEYVEGDDLGAVRHRGPLAPRRALELSLQLCDALAFAQERLGIVHRDVKPANCLLAADDRLQLTDFGLARAFGAAREPSLQLAELAPELGPLYSTPLGSRPYMAPEQFDPDAVLDARTDIYALGIVLYQLLGGERPRSGAVAKQHALAAREHGELPREKLLLPIVLRCVEPDPALRPQTFAELRGELEGAYRAITRITAPGPQPAFTMVAADWDGRGRALENLGRYKEAIACYDRGIELEPGDASLWSHRGKALLGLGSLDEALASAKRALELAPTVAPCWANKAATLMQTGRLDDALECYDRALELDPDDHIQWFGRAHTLMLLERLDEALACVDRGLAIAPTDARLWRERSMVLMRLGRPDDALDSTDRGLAIAPRDHWLWLSRSVALTALSRPDEALACCERGLEIKPDDRELLSFKGHALMTAGRLEEALACFTHGLKLGPPVPASLWFGRGVVLAALGRLEQAALSYHRGLKLDPSSRAAWHDRAALLADLGRYREALEAVDRGLQIAPAHAPLWRIKAHVLERLGRKREARDCKATARGLKSAR